MKYGVRLEGSNYEVDLDGKVQLLGFITTRFVGAGSIQEAEQKAIGLIFGDSHLNNLMTGNSTFQATVRAVEIWQESWWKKLGGKGYSFYPMPVNEE